MHAGWRGTVAKIAAKSVGAMQEAFGTSPQAVVACIGPSIGPCCYQVGEDVISQVRPAFNNDDLLLKQNGSIYLDLWQANAQQLTDMGVEQIEIAETCTGDHTEDFYSWRAEKKKTGRFGTSVQRTQCGANVASAQHDNKTTL